MLHTAYYDDVILRGSLDYFTHRYQIVFDAHTRRIKMLAMFHQASFSHKDRDADIRKFDTFTPRGR